MLAKFSSISEPYWDDKPVFIIGGGESLKDFHFSSIKGKGLSAGCNDSAFRAGTDVEFSLDQTWHNNRKDQLKSFDGIKIIAMPANFEFQRHAVEGVQYIIQSRGQGFSERPDYVFGVNSGYAAVNLAFLKKAKEIYLFGLDFSAGENSNHWHEGYKWHQQRNGGYYAKWAYAFELPAVQMREAGIKVVNVNPRKSIPFFPQITFDEFYKEMESR